MDVDAGMMHYDSRPVTTAPLSRPVLAPHYFSAPSYSPAPMPSMPAPLYSYDAYSAYSPPASAMGSPYRPHFPERPPLRLVSEPDMSQVRALRREPSVRVEGSRSPSVKSEAQMSVARSVASVQSGPARTISSIVPVNPANQVSFNTEVDVLVKALQSKRDTDTIVKKVEAGHLAQTDDVLPEPVEVAGPAKSPYPEADWPRIPGRPNRTLKHYECDISDCGKTFHQKTHLDIHIRSHTGDKPYFCKLPGCGSRFSQLGNLKTHERRHTGEKPFLCEQCGKRFAQRGNVRAHLKTHLNTKPFQCRLDDCNKRFTQLGNLKSHQNKFHAKTIKRLTQKFAQLKDYNKASEAERELWEYFATLYKNSNKGIKGRGKDRKVDPGPHGATPMTPKPTTVPSSHAALSAQQQQQASSPGGHAFSQYASPALQLPLPHGRVGHPPVYNSMGRSSFAGGSAPPVSLGAYRGAGGGQPDYDMFEVVDISAVVGAPAQPNPGPMYEVDQARGELAFGDRLYS